MHRALFADLREFGHTLNLFEEDAHDPQSDAAGAASGALPAEGAVTDADLQDRFDAEFESSVAAEEADPTDESEKVEDMNLCEDVGSHVHQRAQADRSSQDDSHLDAKVKGVVLQVRDMLQTPKTMVRTLLSALLHGWDAMLYEDSFIERPVSFPVALLRNLQIPLGIEREMLLETYLSWEGGEEDCTSENSENSSNEDSASEGPASEEPERESAGHAGERRKCEEDAVFEAMTAMHPENYFAFLASCAAQATPDTVAAIGEVFAIVAAPPPEEPESDSEPDRTGSPSPSKRARMDLAKNEPDSVPADNSLFAGEVAAKDDAEILNIYCTSLWALPTILLRKAAHFRRVAVTSHSIDACTKMLLSASLGRVHLRDTESQAHARSERTNMRTMLRTAVLPAATVLRTHAADEGRRGDRTRLGAFGRVIEEYEAAVVEHLRFICSIPVTQPFDDRSWDACTSVLEDRAHALLQRIR